MVTIVNGGRTWDKAVATCFREIYRDLFGEIERRHKIF
jgi:hypothetical protein